MGTAKLKGEYTDRVAENVRRLRENSGLSLRALSRLVGDEGQPLLPTAIFKIENGTRRTDVDDLAALAKALGTTPHHLMGWHESGVTPETVEDVVARFLDLRAEMDRLGEVVKEIREKEISEKEARDG